MTEDRTELANLADGEKERVAAMSRHYAEWAERARVVQWPVRANPHSSAGGESNAHVVAQ